MVKTNFNFWNTPKLIVIEINNSKIVNITLKYYMETGTSINIADKVFHQIHFYWNCSPHTTVVIHTKIFNKKGT